MKKIGIIVSILCSYLVLFAVAEISFEKTVYDFGRIEEDNGSYEYIFKFVNAGDKPLKLIKVKAG